MSSFRLRQMKNDMSKIEDRCRLVLVAPDIPDGLERVKLVGDALKGGDVASVIVPQYGLSDADFQKHVAAARAADGDRGREQKG